MPIEKINIRYQDRKTRISINSEAIVVLNELDMTVQELIDTKHKLYLKPRDGESVSAWVTANVFGVALREINKLRRK